MKTFLWGVLILAAAGCVIALAAPTRLEKPPPPAPLHYFNDYANLVSPEFARGKDFWVQISPAAKFVTVIYPHSPEGSIDEFTTRAAHHWQLGQAGVNDGLILFVFRDERTLRLEVAYGLEGTLTDLDSRRILANLIAPSFTRGDYEGGLDAGMEAIQKLLDSAGDIEATGPPSLRRYMIGAMRNLPSVFRDLWANSSRPTPGIVSECPSLRRSSPASSSRVCCRWSNRFLRLFCCHGDFGKVRRCGICKAAS